MLKNFSFEELRKNKVFAQFKKNKRRSLIGMLLSWRYSGQYESIVHLEKKKVVAINRSYHCNCGGCDPEWLITLISPKDNKEKRGRRTIFVSQKTPPCPGCWGRNFFTGSDGITRCHACG